MILLSVEKFSSSQPCSNIPMQCLRCHNWTNKYSMEDHIKDTCEVGGVGNNFRGGGETLSTEEEEAFLLTKDEISGNLQMLTRTTLSASKGGGKAKAKKKKKGEEKGTEEDEGKEEDKGEGGDEAKGGEEGEG